MFHWLMRMTASFMFQKPKTIFLNFQNILSLRYEILKRIYPDYFYVGVQLLFYLTLSMHIKWIKLYYLQFSDRMNIYFMLSKILS